MALDQLSAYMGLSKLGLKPAWIQKLLDTMQGGQAIPSLPGPAGTNPISPVPPVPNTRVMPPQSGGVPITPQTPPALPTTPFYSEVTNPNYYAPGPGNLYADQSEAAMAGKYPDLWNQYLAAIKRGEKLSFGEWTQNQMMPKIGLTGMAR